MAELGKVLGQLNPGAASLTDLYTVPGSINSVISTVMVSNRSSVATSFRISIAPGGAADSLEQYIYYDIAIPGNDTFAATIGITLETTDVVRVYATLATLSFSAFGIERAI